jgi:hypothetical protein
MLVVRSRAKTPHPRHWGVFRELIAVAMPKPAIHMASRSRRGGRGSGKWSYWLTAAPIGQLKLFEIIVLVGLPPAG